MRTLSTLILCLGLSQVSYAQAPADAIATVDAFHAAMEAGDSVAALELLDRDVVVYESGRAEVGRAEYRAHHLAVDIEAARSIERDIIERHSGGSDTVAWVITRTRSTGTFRDRTIDSEGDETMILEHTTSGWLIVHIHWSQRSRS